MLILDVKKTHRLESINNDSSFQNSYKRWNNAYEQKVYIDL